ncbi:ABC transporter substrate-binding protein [Georgenia sp. SYP-B2076]|uniref:ABC transporter substrate-binding protein n=1 Tax=Georgenia sp. SYP-B2076 TaxID=2495881 RepID=UPI000F8D5FED|nr:ABC transporter substrate-binding protein [Georgenia sp. SYP-B2076]
MTTRTRRRLAGAVAVVTLSLTAAACGGGASPGGSTGGGSASAGGGGTVKVGLPTSVTSFANADIVVADELGYFKDVGLKVDVTNLKSGTSVTTGVVSGNLQVGGASIEPVINAAAGGGDVRIIGSYTDRLEVEMVTPESVKSVEDLRGKNLGVQEIGAFREVMTRMVLESAGMTQQDVSYIPTNADAYISALLQGRIDSAILHPEQAIAAEQQDPSLHALVNLYKVEPDYYYGVYFVSDKWLKGNQDTAQKFLQAVTKAHRTMYDDKAKVVPIIAKATGFDAAVIDQAWGVYMTEIQAFPKNEGLEQNRLDYTVKRMGELGTLRKGEEPDLGTLVDRKPITAAVKELGKADGR